MEDAIPVVIDCHLCVVDSMLEAIDNFWKLTHEVDCAFQVDVTKINNQLNHVMLIDSHDFVIDLPRKLVRIYIIIRLVRAIISQLEHPLDRQITRYR